ncbi:MAG: hypothetical protein C4334_10605 [Pyrinomonas sp.]
MIGLWLVLSLNSQGRCGRLAQGPSVTCFPPFIELQGRFSCRFFHRGARCFWRMKELLPPLMIEVGTVGARCGPPGEPCQLNI